MNLMANDGLYPNVMESLFMYYLFLGILKLRPKKDKNFAKLSFSVSHFFKLKVLFKAKTKKIELYNLFRLYRDWKISVLWFDNQNLPRLVFYQSGLMILIWLHLFSIFWTTIQAIRVLDNSEKTLHSSKLYTCIN